jgi:hypothetical protein
MELGVYSGASPSAWALAISSSAALPRLSSHGSPGNATRTGTTALTVSQWPVSILSKGLVEMDEIVAWGSLTAARSTRWRSISASRLLTGSCRAYETKAAGNSRPHSRALDTNDQARTPPRRVSQVTFRYPGTIPALSRPLSPRQLNKDRLELDDRIDNNGIRRLYQGWTGVLKPPGPRVEILIGRLFVSCSSPTQPRCNESQWETSQFYFRSRVSTQQYLTQCCFVEELRVVAFRATVQRVLSRHPCTTRGI